MKLLNEQFYSTFSTNDPNVSIPFSPQVCFSRTVIDLKKSKLNKHKPSGTDELHPYVLAECSSSLALPLSLIFCKSLETEQVPQSWKSANLTSIFKKGYKTDPTNYRPISLTSMACKSMERIIRDEMLTHMILHNLIDKNLALSLPGRVSLICWSPLTL